MKARSVVLTHLQHPVTVFGIPPRLLVLVAVPAALLYGLTIVSGGVAVSMIVVAVALTAGLIWAVRMARRDRHIDAIVLAGVSFWGVSSRRWLLAGASPRPRSRGGRR